MIVPGPMNGAFLSGDGLAGATGPQTAEDIVDKLADTRVDTIILHTLRVRQGVTGPACTAMANPFTWMGNMDPGLADSVTARAFARAAARGMNVYVGLSNSAGCSYDAAVVGPDSGATVTTLLAWLAAHPAYQAVHKGWYIPDEIDCCSGSYLPYYQAVATAIRNADSDPNHRIVMSPYFGSTTSNVTTLATDAKALLDGTAKPCRTASACATSAEPRSRRRRHHRRAALRRARRAAWHQPGFARSRQSPAAESRSNRATGSTCRSGSPRSPRRSRGSWWAKRSWTARSCPLMRRASRGSSSSSRRPRTCATWSSISCGSRAKMCARAPLNLVVLANGGGRMFELMPVAEDAAIRPLFEECFLTSRDVKLERLAAAHGLGYVRADAPRALADALAQLGSAPGARIFEVGMGDRETCTVHRAPVDDENPTYDAAELWEAGDDEGARELLMDVLGADLRCLDAHAHLGNWELDRSPEEAMLHYEIGTMIGELSLPPGFDGLLVWGRLYNRPFLRCLRGYGLCLWRLGRSAEAQRVFERILSMNPNDNQGVRFCWEDVRKGRSWEEMQEREEAERRKALGRLNE